jgi:hypothetical protein
MISTASAVSAAAYNLPTLCAYVMLAHFVYLLTPDPRLARDVTSVVLASGSMISTAVGRKVLNGAANMNFPMLAAFVMRPSMNREGLLALQYHRQKSDNLLESNSAGTTARFNTVCETQETQATTTQLSRRHDRVDLLLCRLIF